MGKIMILLITIGIFLLLLAHLASRDPKEALFYKYRAAVGREIPAWLDQTLNPNFDLRKQYEFTLGEINEVLIHEATSVSAVEVLDHLLTVWPGGILSYNAWYAVGMARRRGLLSQEFHPVVSAAYVDEESRRMEELRQLGGEESVRTYHRIMQ